MATEYPRAPNARDRKAANDAKSMMWSIPAAIAAIVLVAAILIFSSAGPDRTRTADTNNPGAPSSPATQAQPPVTQAQPQKSNPAGTQ
jgi:hypothetical protein